MKALILLLTSLPLIVLAGVPVTTAPLAELLVTPEADAPATVVALNTPVLTSEITARIEEIPVRVGDRLDAGAVVARLDCRTLQSQLEAARAALDQLRIQRDLAVSQLKRARDLQARKGISEETVEQRETDLHDLDSRLTAQDQAIVQARIQVERCTLNAPFEAVVTERLASVGELATPGTPLARLVQVDEVEVSAALRPEEADQIQVASSIRFDYRGTAYPLHLRRLLPVVDERTRTREARFVFLNEGPAPGAAGRVLWDRPEPQIPAEYLVRRKGELGIFYLNGGKAHFHALPGALEGRPAAIDLATDTPVIVEGRQRLIDGEPVDLKD